MSDKPELDQVTDARGKLAAHVEFPTGYWVLHGLALVVIMGLPIWTSFVPLDPAYYQWGLFALVIGFAAYSVIRRRRSGVYLPRYPLAYSSARGIYLGVLAVTLAGLLGLNALVNNDQHTIAILALIPLAALTFAGQYWTRVKMREDLAAGRVVR